MPCDILTYTGRTYDAITTSLLRHNDVVTSFWRYNDIIVTSGARWVCNTIFASAVIIIFCNAVVQYKVEGSLVITPGLGVQFTAALGWVVIDGAAPCGGKATQLTPLWTGCCGVFYYQPQQSIIRNPLPCVVWNMQSISCISRCFILMPNSYFWPLYN